MSRTALAMIVKRSRKKPTIQAKLIAASMRSVRSIRRASFLYADCMLAARCSIPDQV